MVPALGTVVKGTFGAAVMNGAQVCRLVVNATAAAQASPSDDLSPSTLVMEPGSHALDPLHQTMLSGANLIA